MQWEVPDVHIRALHWLETRGDLAVLRCFRGFGKSTILAIYNAWRFYNDPTYRILHQGESDGTAYKTSRDTQNVLRKHPLTRGLLPDTLGTVEQWWVQGSVDARNSSMYAKGVMSNVTSARADECQNDDCETLKNIQTPEAREKLRYRLSEQTHILVPGGKKLYVGTPHTHDSLYDEVERMGADCLTIKIFEKEYRIEVAAALEYELPFVPEYIFSGIGALASVLREGDDYTLKGRTVRFTKVPGSLIDFYAGAAWPERFTLDELEKRRRETRTVNEWDSQYLLHSKPIGEVRLDPEKMRAYEMEPEIIRANGEVRMMLGAARIVSARAYWDCATGKVGGDASVLSVVFDDTAGNYYWQRAEEMLGEFAEFAEDTARIASGQVLQACALVRKFQLSQLYVETNGVGSFVPKLMRKALKQCGLSCAVLEVNAQQNKNEKILAGLEPPLRSGVLWAHVDVLNGPTWDQMKDWNPAVKTQPDDFIDSGASAILQAPVRIGKVVSIDENSSSVPAYDWRPMASDAEVTFDFEREHQ